MALLGRGFGAACKLVSAAAIASVSDGSRGSRQVKIVDYFLSKKIDPNQPHSDSRYKDVLDHACQRNRTGVVDALLNSSLVKAKKERRTLACIKRLHPEVGVNTVPRTE